jgi:SAM-dependent methyltransferase
MTATLLPAADDLLGVAMRDWLGGRRVPVHLRTGDGHRLDHDVGAYFAPVSPEEELLLSQAAGVVLDIGCGPGRHARFLQQRGLAAVGLDCSPSALATASALGLELTVRRDVLTEAVPSGFGTALLLDGNAGLGGTPAGTARLLADLAAAAAPGARLLVSGRAARGRAWRSLVVRTEYRGAIGPWAPWLVPSLDGLTTLAAGAGWRRRVAVGVGSRYWAAYELDGVA